MNKLRRTISPIRAQCLRVQYAPNIIVVIINVIYVWEVTERRKVSMILKANLRTSLRLRVSTSTRNGQRRTGSPKVEHGVEPRDEIAACNLVFLWFTA
jgi:hypothetical protein